MTDETFTIEQWVNSEWTELPFKPRKDRSVYAFNDIGYELAQHNTRMFIIRVEPDKYNFDRRHEYRIAKEVSISGCHYVKLLITDFTELKQKPYLLVQVI